MVPAIARLHRLRGEGDLLRLRRGHISREPEPEGGLGGHRECALTSRVPSPHLSQNPRLPSSAFAQGRSDAYATFPVRTPAQPVGGVKLGSCRIPRAATLSPARRIGQCLMYCASALLPIGFSSGRLMTEVSHNLKRPFSQRGESAAPGGALEAPRFASEFGGRLVALSGAVGLDGLVSRAEMLSPLLAGLAAGERLGLEIALTQRAGARSSA